MEGKQIRRLPVLDEAKRMVGMISLGDDLMAMVVVKELQKDLTKVPDHELMGISHRCRETAYARRALASVFATSGNLSRTLRRLKSSGSRRPQ